MSEVLTKAEFSKVLNSVGVPVAEGESNLDDVKKLPKIVYWEYVWTDSMASGGNYETVVRYQASYCSNRGRDTALKKLKKVLNTAGIHPVMYHEYVKGDSSPGYHHWYFAVDVLENPLEGFEG